MLKYPQKYFFTAHTWEIQLGYQEWFLNDS